MRIIPVSDAAVAYVEEAKVFLRKCVEHREQYKLSFHQDIFDDGVKRFLAKVTPWDERVFIFASGGGFVADTSDHSLQFPLIDDDQHTSSVDLDGTIESFDQENYGNILSNLDDPISWRGPSGAYIPNDPARNITGLTAPSGDQFTPFQPLLYEGGEASDPLPGDVLCAAVIAGTTWAVIRKAGAKELISNASGNWETVASQVTNNELIPCVFFIDKVVLPHGEWTLKGEWTTYTDVTGTVTRGSGWDVTKSIEGIILRPGVTASFTSTDKTTIDDSWTRTPGSVSAYVVATPIVISGTDAPTTDTLYTANGGIEPYTWSVSGPAGVSITSNGVLTGVAGKCPAATITATDSCGATGSLTVRLPGGHWAASSNYAWLHGQDVVGLSVGVWTYFGNYRVKLNSVIFQYNVLHGCSPSSCNAGCTQEVNGFWDATVNFYYILNSIQGWSGCAGTPGGPWWDGTCNTLYDLPKRDGIDYKAYSFSSGAHDCSYHTAFGDPQGEYHGYFYGAPQVYARVYPVKPVYQYNLSFEEWIC